MNSEIKHSVGANPPISTLFLDIYQEKSTIPPLLLFKECSYLTDSKMQDIHRLQTYQ